MTLPPRFAITARFGVIDGRWVSEPYLEVDDGGAIGRTSAGLPADPADTIRDLGSVIILPGFVNAHSHAFQRAIRGATHARSAGDPSSFWSWRRAMYDAATRLDPDGVYGITRRAFAEMLGTGITTVGEFHYLHHQPDGSTYDDPNELSWQIVRAASDAGIDLVLLEVYYARAGAGHEPAPEQRRFCDGSVDAYLSRVDALRARGVTVGLAPHSIRAVPAEALRELADYAARHDLVIHTHLSEQPRENEECSAEHGRSPAAVFAEAGCLDRSRTFTAVHAVHTSADDHRLLADQHVCVCPTTEADLGDGIAPAGPLLAAGAQLALGSDSNAVIDLIQEARLLEMDERLRTGGRLALLDPETTRVGPALHRAATEAGASALGIGGHAGRLRPGAPLSAVTIATDTPRLWGVDPANLLDAVFTTTTAAEVRHVFVRGAEVTA